MFRTEEFYASTRQLGVPGWLLSSGAVVVVVVVVVVVAVVVVAVAVVVVAERAEPFGRFGSFSLFQSTLR